MESWQRHWQTWRARPCHPSSSSHTRRSGLEGLDSVQTGRQRLYQCCAAAPRLTADWTVSRCRRWPSSWHWLPSLLSCGIHCGELPALLTSGGQCILNIHCVCCHLAIADVIDTWLLVIEGVNVLLQLSRNLPPIGLVQSPSALSFLIVFILLLPIYSAMWLLCSSHLHCTYVLWRCQGGRTLKLFTHTATCSALVEMPFIPPESFPRLIYVCSPNWSADMCWFDKAIHT